MLYLFACLFILVLMVYSVNLFDIFNLFLDLNVFPLSCFYWNTRFEFDFVTFGVLVMLLICFSYVYKYTGHYFSGDMAGIELNKIICLFVGVMASLVCTGDFLATLIFWEYLGVVSYFLILFYGSYLSLRASVVTLVSSRFGDVSMFIIIALGSFISWYSLIGGILFFFIVFTKSASFPFISWLLEAMRAPTPVSSLVHSSTLVAAGVWFFMRYDFLMFGDNLFVYSVLLLMTIFITGFCCFFFMDLKKIVALSTCNNIAWCVFYVIFGDTYLSLFQLVSHGVSKCMLFMLVGDVMSGTGGSQSSNCVYSARLYGSWGLFSLFSVVLGLAGVPFIGVFFTKHFLINNFVNLIHIPLFILVMICVLVSYVYSFRLCSVLANLSVSACSGVLFRFNLGFMIFFWLFINFFIFYLLDEVSHSGIGVGVALVLFQLVAFSIAYFLYKSTFFSNWCSSLFGCDNLVELAYEIFFKLLNMASIFFYRWDSIMLSVFNGIGYNTLSVYNINFLNIVMLSIILLLMWWGIVY